MVSSDISCSGYRQIQFEIEMSLRPEVQYHDKRKSNMEGFKQSPEVHPEMCLNKIKNSNITKTGDAFVMTSEKDLSF